MPMPVTVGVAMEMMQCAAEAAICRAADDAATVDSVGDEMRLEMGAAEQS